MRFNEIFEKIASTPRFKFIFKCFASAALGMILVGLVWHLFDKSFNIVLVVGFGLLAMAFYFKAFEPVDEQEDTNEVPTLLTSKGFALFTQKIFWWGASVFTIGILFLIFHWPNHEVLLKVGVGTFVTGLVMKVLSAKARRQR